MLFDEPFSHSNYKPFLHIFERFIDNHFYSYSKALILSNSTLHKIFDKRRKIEKLWDYNYRFFPIINNFPFYFFSNKQVHKSQEKFLRKITRQWFIVLMRYMKISELWRNHRKDTFSNFNIITFFRFHFVFKYKMNLKISGKFTHKFGLKRKCLWMTYCKNDVKRKKYEIIQRKVSAIINTILQLFINQSW